MQTQSSSTSAPIYLWQPYREIFKLTLRQILRNKRTFFVCFVSVLPVGLSVVFRLVRHSTGDARHFIPTMTVTLYLMFVMILIALFYGIAIIADEIDGKTLIYLFMRPLRKYSILLSKFAAYFVGAVALIAPSHLLTTLIVATDPKIKEDLLFHLGMSLKYIGVMSLGLLAYGAIFTALGVRFKHSVLWGLLVAFGWEKIALAVPGNIKKFSVIHYLLSIYPRYNLPTRMFQRFMGDSPPAPWLAFMIILLIAAFFLFLSGWIFQHHEYET